MGDESFGEQSSTEIAIVTISLHGCSAIAPQLHSDHRTIEQRRVDCVVDPVAVKIAARWLATAPAQDWVRVLTLRGRAISGSSQRPLIRGDRQRTIPQTGIVGSPESWFF